MAFNPSPQVVAARDFAEKFKKRQVVVISMDDTRFSYCSYGVTKTECNKAKQLADCLFEATKEFLTPKE